MLNEQGNMEDSMNKRKQIKEKGGKSEENIVEKLRQCKIELPAALVRQLEKEVKGKNDKEIKQLINDAHLLEKNGVFAIVLECVKTPIAKKITQNLNIPTIGIGSSVHCDGQVLVTDDLLGLNQTKIKFVKKFLNIKKYINVGLKRYASEVRSKKYPSKKHSY